MTKKQAEILQASGISFPFLWVVLADHSNVLVVKNSITGAVKAIEYDPVALLPMTDY